MSELTPRLARFEDALIAAAHRDLQRSRRRRLLAVAASALLVMTAAASAATGLLRSDARRDLQNVVALAHASDPQTIWHPERATIRLESSGSDRATLTYFTSDSGRICIILKNGRRPASSSCGRTADQGGVIWIAQSSEIAGVADSGVASITATVNGGRHRVTIQNHAFYANFNADGFESLSRITITRTDGTTRQIGVWRSHAGKG
jgi:hypothetical protein